MNEWLRGRSPHCSRSNGSDSWLNLLGDGLTKMKPRRNVYKIAHYRLCSPVLKSSGWWRRQEEVGLDVKGAHRIRCISKSRRVSSRASMSSHLKHSSTFIIFAIFCHCSLLNSCRSGELSHSPLST